MNSKERLEKAKAAYITKREKSNRTLSVEFVKEQLSVLKDVDNDSIMDSYTKIRKGV